jgi:hypothetical protein
LEKKIQTKVPEQLRVADEMANFRIADDPPGNPSNSGNRILRSNSDESGPALLTPTAPHVLSGFTDWPAFISSSHAPSLDLRPSRLPRASETADLGLSSHESRSKRRGLIAQFKDWPVGGQIRGPSSRGLTHYAGD